MLIGEKHLEENFACIHSFDRITTTIYKKPIKPETTTLQLNLI